MADTACFQEWYEVHQDMDFEYAMFVFLMSEDI
jgi:hypothetical protein